MKFKNQICRLFNKKASASVGVAIKVLTSVVLGAAMLAGTYGVVKTNVVPTAENKVSSMFEVTDTVELSGGGGVLIPDPVVEIKRNGVIPEGAVYYQGGEQCIFCYSCYGVIGVPHGPMYGCPYEFEGVPTATYSTGENFPVSPSVGDIYVEGDYIYSYFSTGWHVRAAESKSVYGAIVSEIAGKPLTNMFCTFYGCTSLTTAPTIPSSVTSIGDAFDGCTSLTTAPTIPNGVTHMNNTFYGCTSLTTAPTIPNSVTNIDATFYGCTSLTTAPAIPNGVTNMRGTFSGCTSLKTYIGSTDADGDFSNYAIPSGVTHMNNTFYGCTSLTNAPAIPSSVTNMEGTFYCCTSLTGTIEINANPAQYNGCFTVTSKPITLIGSSTILNELANTANKGNVRVG